MIRRRTAWLIALIVLVTLGSLGVAVVAYLPDIVRQTAVWRLEALTKRRVAIERVELSVFTGHVAVRGLRVADREGPGTLATIDRIEGRVHRRSLWSLRVWIEDLAIAGVDIRLVRLPDGRLNISDLLERPAEPRGLVDVTIDRLRADGSAISFEDRTLKPARTWTVERIEIDGRGLSSATAGGSLEFRSVAAGAPLHVKVEDFRLAPIHLSAHISAANVDLGLLRLYLPGDAAVLPESGILAAGLTVVHDATEGTRISAGARVSRVVLERRGPKGAFATSPEITIALNDLAIKGGDFSLGRAEVEGDLSVVEALHDPPLRYDFSKTRLLLEDVAWPSRRPGRVAFSGGLPGGGSLDVRGTIASDPPRADLAVKALRLPVDLANRYARLTGTLGGIADVDARVVARLEKKQARITVSGSVGGTRLVVADPARPGAPPLTVERLDASGIEVEWPTRVSVGLLSLRKPRAHLERDATGALTLRALFTPRDAGGAAPTPRSGAVRPTTEVTTGELRVQDGALTVVDGTLTPPPRFEVATLGLVATNVAWPARGAAQVSLDATLVGGGSVRVTGSGELDRRTAQLRVTARDFDVARAQPYLPFRGRVQGRVEADLDVRGRLDPFRARVRGTVSARDVALADADRPLLTSARVDASGIDYRVPESGSSPRLTVGRVELSRPRAHVERDAAGALTLRDLFTQRDAAGTTPAPATGSVRATTEVTIGELRVQDGALTVVDGTLTPAPRLQVTTLGLVVKNATWPARGPMQVSLDATLAGGGTIQISGTSQLDRQNARLTVVARNLDAAQAQPYLPFRGRVQGRLSADLDVRGRLEPFRARVRGTVGASDVALADADRQLLTIARVDVTGIDYRAPAQVQIDDVHVVKPFALIERDERGELSIRQALTAPPRPPAPEPVPSAQGPALRPEVFVRHVLVEDGGTNIVDASVEPAARFQVRGSRLEARNLTYPVRMPAEVALATPMPRGGRLEGRGTFQVEPGRMDVNVTLTEVALSPAQPYLPVGARVGGKVDGEVRISGTFEPFTLSVRGSAAVKELAVGDANRQLLTAGRARAEGVDVQWPGGVRVARVEIERPWVLFEREASGRFPLVDLLWPRGARAASKPPAATADPGSRAASEPLSFELGTLAITDGFGRFVDRTTDPDFAEELSAVNLTLQGLGNTPESKARTALRATLGPRAALSISGEFGTLGAPLSVDALFTLGGYAAPRTNAYLLTLFGWTAPEGMVSLAAHYRIQGDALEATNDVGVDGLQVVKPRDCCVKPPKWPVGLPLDTFVALLKDRQGHIELSLPVHGRLSSPEFDLGDAIWSALRGLAVKVVGLPFTAIGRLFFTEDSRIEALSVNPVTFVAGTSTPAPGMTEHLDRLARFLREKPAIRLQLRPVLTVADVEPLKREALRERLRSRAKDASDAALREQALQVFTRRYPKREPPVSLDELLAALAADVRSPAAAGAALGEHRVKAVRDALTARGADAGRLVPHGATPAVETEGTGRVEFEITQ